MKLQPRLNRDCFCTGEGRLHAGTAFAPGNPSMNQDCFCTGECREYIGTAFAPKTPHMNRDCFRTGDCHKHPTTHRDCFCTKKPPILRDCLCTGAASPSGLPLHRGIATHDPRLLLHRRLPLLRPHHEHRNCESSECKKYQDGFKWTPPMLLVLSLLSLLLLLSLALV